ncbi:MAG: FAD-dependent oxidoreductase, partial [Nitrospinaceae bacterium]|nr:FAD-dependent oxidoreductase [Nitrospinaceae bacterium]
GEYYELKPEKRDLVKGLIYPVPDPSFPFLGVHFTRRVDGTVEAGPNAVLAFKREGYTRTSANPGDILDTFSYPGFWRLARKYWRVGVGEMYRSASKGAFTRALQKLMPDLQEEDIIPGGAGVRAQAVDSEGKLVDDFAIVHTEGAVHVCNAPSPGATASLMIGKKIADMVEEAHPALAG